MANRKPIAEIPQHLTGREDWHVERVDDANWNEFAGDGGDACVLIVGGSGGNRSFALGYMTAMRAGGETRELRLVGPDGFSARPSGNRTSAPHKLLLSRRAIAIERA